MRRAGAVLVGAVVCGVVAAPALAFNFFELEVYPATTEGKGLHEVENITSFVANGRRPDEEEAAGETPRRHRLLRTSLEYDYGLTDKIDIKVLQTLSATQRRYRGVLAYQVSDALSGQLQLDNEHLSTSTDFGADLKFKWEGE